MGKKNKEKNLGRALIKDRFGSNKRRRNNADSFLHTVDMQDGYDWGQLNLQSVTEESSFQEFLHTAELAGTEFQAEKLNIKFVNPKSGVGLLTKQEHDQVIQSQEKNKELLKIPRQPLWDENTTANELQTKEKEVFLEWRRRLALLQEEEGLLLTPYEKNLELWRQLWRVIRRSDVVVQIVDARNPLLFRCEDLENYVKEIDPNKLNMILINKADYLTEQQRKIWAEYFMENKIRVAFFSATLAAQKETIEETISEEEERSEEEDSIEGSDMESIYTSDFIEESETFFEESEYESATDNLNLTTVKRLENLEIDEPIKEEIDFHSAEIHNSAELLTREELITLFRTMYPLKTYMKGVTTIGLVGYPNVGKSSTINALLMDKKVSVSATPGKTKHFQTLYLGKDVLLCDCPGLVMPSFVCTKADMVLNGVLPINHLRDHVPSVNLLGTLIPRHVIEDLYGIIIPLPIEGEDPDRPPLAEEILNAHAFNRGFMTQNGQPDCSRSARYVLKDFIIGKLLYCVAPPGYDQQEFHTFPPKRRKDMTHKQLPPRVARAIKSLKKTAEDIDRNFQLSESGNEAFRKCRNGVHVKGKSIIGHINSMMSLNSTGTAVVGSNASLYPGTIDGTESMMGSTLSISTSSADKPWRRREKKQREKGRRLYAHLDQH
ncbi:large subunit GTPase 1 homolog [Copidosoma floridanum]|uniref:large subunit GTPase 1 homolog n=1 Tax=Copidosoma floridanum TaxID=29053 RepID=UPI0006C97B67|nr:large subunit GTPase 1 homolog [Copidosoma floridanum]